MNILNFIADYWFVILAFLACGAFGGIKAYNFLNKPQGEQIEQIKNVIYSLVMEAERLLGTKTGQAKFVQVIAWFYERLPFDLTKIISKEQLEQIINESVDKMKKYFETNPIGAVNVLNATTIPTLTVMPVTNEIEANK